jgi:hypothetical protein
MSLSRLLHKIRNRGIYTDMAKPNRDLRSMRQAAMAGNHSAARELLKLYGYGEIAREIKPNHPFTNRVQRMVGVLTAGTGAGDEVGPWESRNERTGEIESDILDDPPSLRGARARAPILQE